MVKNPPCNAGRMGLIPGQGTKIPHAARQLSRVPQPRESTACAATKTQCSQIFFFLKKVNKDFKKRMRTESRS